MKDASTIPTDAKTAPLTESDIAFLNQRLFGKGRFLKEFAMLPMRISALSIIALPPLLLGTGLCLVVYRLFSSASVTPSAVGRVLVTLWLPTILIIAFFVIRSFLRDYKERQLHNPSLRADLEMGVKIGETLEIEEALCVQEVEHRGLFYFCRVSDGRVFLILDEASACWDDEDLAEGYRRGVDPRQKRFVPLGTLTIWHAPNSKMFLGEEFSGPPVPLIEGIYEGSPFDDFPRDDGDFGRPPQVHTSWEEIVRSYPVRVDWSEIIARAGHED